MAEKQPKAEAMMEGPESSEQLLDWQRTRQQLADARTFWLSTVRADGRPHVAPVWAVWLDGMLLFSTAARSVKGRNLAREPRCVMSIESGTLHVVVEGSASRFTDEALLRRMADVYSAKYDWRMQVRDGEITDPEGNGGPVFGLTPAIVLGFETGGGGLIATRWVFE